ncbi:hypothetical protein PR202_gb23505 [Eleusine coracana subsp. coracana]|uniref:Protein kinase domain-containing protein n=1 Tax=Eleusine coracana subsp. coracana TaxID=191504 RepID=A0AAV5FGC5_ELECO|nr:hypothetical protein PR202_gb23505 [Eleusine coracana subsp. coracana]
MAIRHENIVELVGFCHEERSDVMSHNRRYVIVDIKDYLLCYEYLPKGSLDRHLYAKTLVIDWDTRWKIITGICHGLHFLHQRPEGPLIHMNLEPSSIWFDDNWVPKIANFGLSRIFGQEQTRMHTINVVGRIGYMAPEYLYRGEISTRSDIYSLGMIIIQITTGEINDLNSEDISGRKFIEKVHKNWWSSEDTVTSKYPSLDEYRIQQLKSCMIIGLKCVEADRNKRPSMVDIVNKLNGKQVKIFDEVRKLGISSHQFFPQRFFLFTVILCMCEDFCFVTEDWQVKPNRNSLSTG